MRRFYTIILFFVAVFCFSLVAACDKKNAEEYTLTLTKEGTGTVSGAGKYEQDASVTVTAQAAEGYNFDGWFDGSIKKSNQAAYTFIMPARELTLRAVFIPIDYTLTLTKEGGGSVSGGGKYEQGSSVTIIAQAAEGHDFQGWYDGSIKKSNQAVYAFVMPANKLTLRAVFTPIDYTLKLLREGSGTVSGEGKFVMGNSVTVTAEPTSGYNFSGWYDGAKKVFSKMIYTFDMPSKNLTLTAKFLSNFQMTQMIQSMQPDRTVAYKTVAGRNLYMYIFEPAGEASGCVMSIHGGGWNSGSPQVLFPHAAYFAVRGAVSVAVEYRFSADFRKNPQDGANDVRVCIEDCVDALKYLRELYPDLSVTVMGESAGGHLACCLGSNEIVKRFDPGGRAADFVVDLAGVTDLTKDWWNYVITPSERPQLTTDCSPVYNISEGDAPVYILHGTKDDVVFPSMASAYYAALQEKNVKAELEFLEGAQHTFILFYYTSAEYIFSVLVKIGNKLSDESMI